jgi:hypothetical protein
MVAEHKDVGGDHERRSEAEAERRPGDKLKPLRRHVTSRDLLPALDAPVGEESPGA